MKQKDILVKSPAYHEAGHIVSAYYFCIPVYGVNIYETETTLGNAYIMNKLRLKFLNNIQYLEYIKSILAGHIAELMYAEKNCKMTSSFQSKIFKGCTRDYISVGDLIEMRFIDNEIDTGILIDEIKSFLMENWEAVEVLAEALLRNKELSFNQIDNLLKAYF